MYLRIALLTLPLALLPPPAPAASGRTELLELRNTIVNLVDALVEQGVLTAEKAEALKREARAKAAEDAAREGAARTETEVLPEATPPGEATVVRVPYVPEFVKEEIRAEVRKQLREDVLADVEQKAKDERWGTPDALPDWVNRFHFSGSLRLRFQSDTFDSANPQPGDPNAPINFTRVNADQQLLNNPDIFFNFAETRDRVRLQLKLAVMAEVSDSVLAGVELTTGNLETPLSTNENLGGSLRRKEFAVDRAFVEWTHAWADDSEFLRATAGRFANPFLSTDLLWDEDLRFDGFVGSVRVPFSSLPLLASDDDQSSLFLTAGIFPLDLDEIARDDASSNVKWLYGGQLGLDFRTGWDLDWKTAVSLFDYVNIVGRLNTETLAFNPGVTPSIRTDWSAPDFMQKGNTLYPIKFDSTQAFPPPILYGLAPDFTLLNVTSRLRLSVFDPVDVVLTADAVKNIAYDDSSVARRTGFRVDERTLGYSLRLDIGHAALSTFGNWRLFGGYKHLQRDAVVDGFTDSGFHLGGTNAEGWVMGALLALTPRTQMRVRYFSADEIDGYNDNLVPGQDDTPVGIDVLQFDLKAFF